jgi:hypothetical protein
MTFALRRGTREAPMNSRRLASNILPLSPGGATVMESGDAGITADRLRPAASD